MLPMATRTAFFSECPEDVSFWARRPGRQLLGNCVVLIVFVVAIAATASG